MFVATTTQSMTMTITTRAQSSTMPRRACLTIGECRCCCREAGTAKTSSATKAAT